MKKLHSTILLIFILLVLNGFLQAGIIGKWTFDEMSGTTLTDQSGNGNHGTIHGATWWEDGGVKGLQFDGIDDFIEIPHNDIFNFSTDDFAIEAVFKTDIIPNESWGAIWSKHNTANWHDKEIFLNISGTVGIAPGKAVFELSDGTGYFERAISTTDICDGQFHTVRGVREGGKIKIYVDGILEHETSATINPDKNNPVNIGRSLYRNACCGYFNGVIDKITLWHDPPPAPPVNSQYDLVVEELTDVPLAMNQLITSYFTLDNKIYIFGGRLPTTTSLVQAYDEIRVYDIVNDSWSELPFKMPYEIADNGEAPASFFNNHFYVPPSFATGDAGGWGSHNKIIDVDLVNGTAIETHAFPTNWRIWNVGNCEANGKIYFFGGHMGADRTEIFEYDPQTDVLQQVGNMSMPQIGVNPTFANNGWIYYWSWRSSQIERFNPTTYQIETMSAKMPYSYNQPYWTSNPNSNWHIPADNAFYFFSGNPTPDGGVNKDPVIYKYDYANDFVENTGLNLEGVYTNTHAVKDENDQYVLYAFKYNPDHYSPYQINKLTLSPKQSQCELIGYWKFDEMSGNTAYDSSGYDNNGQVINATWFEENGRKGLAFDGEDDYVSVPHDNLFNLSDKNFSIVCWTKVNTFDRNHHFIRKHHDHIENGYQFVIIGAQQIIDFTYGNNITNFTFRGNIQLNIDEWYMLSVTYDHTLKKVKLYVNDELDTEFDHETQMADNTFDLWFGHDDSPLHWDYDGAIDDIRIYNCALTETEIVNLFQTHTNSLTATKSDALSTDNDNDGNVDPGDKIKYTIILTNTGSSETQGIIFTDNVDANTTLIVGSVTTTNGTITKGNVANDTSVEINVGSVPGNGGTVTITFEATVNSPVPGGVTAVNNQGVFNGNGVTNLLTDDPDTGTPDDATVTQLSADFDNDAIPNDIEGHGDRDGDNIPNDHDFDPQGWIYNEVTGEIVSGGTITVNPLTNVNIVHDGSSGFYQFFVSGAEAEYTLSYTPPAGNEISTTCSAQPGPLDPTGGPNPYVLGSSKNGTSNTLVSNECSNNPYYWTFRIAPGDPFIINNNIPLKQVAATNITLSSFSARVNNKTVNIQWTTETEPDNAGFNIYRSRDEADNYEKINTTLIPAQGNASTGASYSFADTPTDPGTHYYKLEAVSLDGSNSFHGPIEAAGVTSVEAEKLSLPDKYYLSQNYPNPFNPETIIQYNIPKDGFVKLNIYDMQGQLVRNLLSEKKSAGIYFISWNGKNNNGTKVTSSVYLYYFKSGDFSSTKKMILMK